MKHRELIAAIDNYLEKKGLKVEGNVLLDSKGKKIIDGNLNKGTLLSTSRINRF